MDQVLSATIGKLAESLAAAQAEIEDAKKDAVNPHFKNRYATLSSVRAAVTAAFSKHGLSVTQTFEPHGTDAVMVVTWLFHKSGEWLCSRLYMPVSKKDPQGFGSAISYARRYALAAIAGVASDDDDGEEATKPGPVKAQPKSTQPKAPSGVDVAAILESLTGAKTPVDLAKAGQMAASAKSSMTPEEYQQCLAAYKSTERQILNGASPS